MKAYLKSYRQAPRKVRLVANLMKGKTAESALAQLDALPKRASLPMRKLLLSAVANAKQNSGIELKDLFVKEVRVDQGMILKRSMPKSHGSAHPIHKHTSHVLVELVERVSMSDAKKATKASGRASKDTARHDSAESKTEAPVAKAKAAPAKKAVKKTK